MTYSEIPAENVFVLKTFIKIHVFKAKIDINKN